MSPARSSQRSSGKERQGGTHWNWNTRGTRRPVNRRGCGDGQGRGGDDLALPATSSPSHSSRTIVTRVGRIVAVGFVTLSVSAPVTAQPDMPPRRSRISRQTCRRRRTPQLGRPGTAPRRSCSPTTPGSGRCLCSTLCRRRRCCRPGGRQQQRACRHRGDRGPPHLRLPRHGRPRRRTGARDAPRRAGGNGKHHPTVRRSDRRSCRAARQQVAQERLRAGCACCRPPRPAHPCAKEQSRAREVPVHACT